MQPTSRRPGLSFSIQSERVEISSIYFYNINKNRYLQRNIYLILDIAGKSHPTFEIASESKHMPFFIKTQRIV
jgi:hypothetical protein